MSKTILIVDDDPDMVDLLRLALKGAGYATQTARTGREALLKAQRAPPDLVLLDVMLPDLNGFTVCESLRHNPATASVSIIMMTVLPGEFPRLVGAELGADAYCSKPFRVPELISQVGEVLRQSCARHAQQELPLPIVAPSTFMPAGPRVQEHRRVLQS